MILFNFFIGLFVIFISPQIFVYYRYPTIRNSLVLVYGFILSLTFVWVTLLLTYYLNLPNIFVYTFAWIIFISSFIYMYLHINTDRENSHHQYHFLTIFIALIVLMPIIQYTGSGFQFWDAVASWHKWALDLYHNKYNPLDAAYPVLLPSLWAILYKIQDTSQIWWTSRVVLFIFPFYVIVLSLTLYKEYKNIAFLFISILLYPYLLWSETIAGNMDMPVMLLGITSLIVMYTAELNKENKQYVWYVYASLLLAGLASIVKQAGLAFIVFDFIYILLNIKLFKDKKQLLIVSFLTILYFLTYLTLYNTNSTHGTMGNINWLKHLSKERTLEEFTNIFFSYPPQLPFTKWLTGIPRLTPYLLGIGIGLLVFKKARQYNSIGLLSLIFAIMGFFVWTQYFSYDARNSYWVKAFVIIFVSINIKYLIDWYTNKQFNPMVLLLILISIPMMYFIQLGNAFTYKTQLTYQKSLGDEKRIKYIVKEVQQVGNCVKLYTNNHFFTYNLYAKQISKHVVDKEFDLDFLRQSVENTCKDGSFILFRYTTITYPFWRHVKKLIKDKKILKYKGSKFFFYVPPYTTLEEKYFEK